MNNDKNETTVTLRPNRNHQRTFTSIEIFYRGKANSVREENIPFTVGRDLGKCDLMLDNKLVSRKHFALTIKDGLIGLTDMSTNGTWVQLGRAQAVHVKNSFLPLIGSGTIQAGREVKQESQENCLLFKVIYD